MDVAEAVAYAKAVPKFFNVQIMELADRYNDHIKVNYADCYFN